MHTLPIWGDFLFGFSAQRRFTSELKMNESNALLAEYVKNGSDTAFREFVARYVGLVYSTALRQVNGDCHLAEDVAQSVFLHLARKAHRLSSQVMLGGWLHQDTCHVAATLLRGERRRRLRERQAAEMNELRNSGKANLAHLGPGLDIAINQLGPEDRAAILLRFFEQRDLRSVGEQLGRSEDAARMRVNRALEKLHVLLKRRGVTLSVAALGASLTSEALAAAPAGLGASLAASALAEAASVGGFAAALAKFATTANLKFGLLTGVLLACAGAPLVLEHRAQTRLREENQSLQHQLAQQTGLSADNERLSNHLAQANGSLADAKAQVADLLRLRAEVARLREATNELEWLRRERVQWAPRAPVERPAEHARKTDQPQFIYIGGEVKTPNRYPWTEGMTLARLIQAAHGFTDQADKTMVRVTRDADSSRSITTIAVADPVALPESALLPGDQIFIPRVATNSASEPQASASERP
jgi:RNA polymerase sigma factor (sigma-70 family)